MPINKIRSYCYIFFILSHCLIISIPPIDERLKSVCEQMAKWPSPYCYASPVYGIFCDQTSEMKNQLLFSESENVLKKLLGLLFHATIGNEFRITSYAPYTNFNRQTITHLIAWVLMLMQKEMTTSSDHLIEKIRSTLNGSKKNPVRLKELLSTIENCVHQEQEKKIRLYSTMHALLLFMYLKADSSRRLYDYMIDLKNTFHHVFAEPYSIEINDSLALRQQLIELVLNKARARIDSKQFPGHINFLCTLSYKNNPPFADCTEAVLLDLARIIYTSLSPAKRTQDAIVYNFFSKYSTQEIEKNLKARQDWLALCSDQLNVSYRKNGYEVNPSLKNMVVLLRTFFGLPRNDLDSWLDWNEQFKKICSALSHDFFVMKCTRLQAKSDTHVDLQIQLQKLIEETSSKLTLYLHIRNDHAWISRKTYNENIDYMPVLEIINENCANHSNDIAHLTWLHSSELLNVLNSTHDTESSSKQNLEKWKSLTRNLKKRVTGDVIKQLLYSVPTDSDEHLYHLSKHALWAYNQSRNNCDHSFATNVIDRISDTHFIYKSVLTVANYGFHLPFKSVIISKFPQLESDEQDDIISSLVYRKAYKDRDFALLTQYDSKGIIA